MAELKDKKIVVTGATGFIGSEIVRALTKTGAQVVALSKAEVDICDTNKLREVLAGAWAVVHQGGLPPIPLSVKDPLASHQANVTGALSVLVAARDAAVDRVIYASSTMVYGNSQVSPQTETLRPEPRSPYGVQKYAVELYAKLFYDLYGLKTIGLRYGNVYGPGQNPAASYVPVVTTFLTQMLAGQAPTLLGDGQQMRDFVFVTDVAEANLLALGAESGWGEVFNISSGEGLTLLDLVGRINQILKTNIEPVHLPPRLGDVAGSMIDITKAQSILGYRPSVNLDQGLALTADYYRSLLAK